MTLTSELNAMARMTRGVEHETREHVLLCWRDLDIAAAREWRAWGLECPEIDTREDVRRNVRYARIWNHELIRLRRRRKLQ